MQSDVKNPYNARTFRFEDGSTVDTVTEVARLIGSHQKFGDIKLLIDGRWTTGFWRTTPMTFYITTASGATLASTPKRNTGRLTFEPMECYP